MVQFGTQLPAPARSICLEVWMQLGTLCCSRAGTYAAALSVQDLYKVVLCAACLYKVARKCSSREKARSAAAGFAKQHVPLCFRACPSSCLCT